MSIEGTNVALDASRLHDSAHAAILRRRDEAEGAHPLETALVAVADSQHPVGSRRMAESAYEQMLVWLQGNQARTLGDDAAAIALTARAAFQLRGGDREVAARAVQVVAATCSSGGAPLAPLHVALIAWALDPVIPDRGDTPWDQVRLSLAGLSTTGVNGALVALARQLAYQTRPGPDPQLANATPLDRSEECLLLWALTASLAAAAEGEPTDTETLEALRRRRTELLVSLTRELSTQDAHPVVYQDFDPFTEPADEPAVATLGLFEATILDLTLSGREPHQALITLAEADRLDEVRKHRRCRWYAAVATAATIIVTAMACTISVLADGSGRLTTGLAIMLLSAGSAGSLLFLRGAAIRWNVTYLLTGLALESPLGVVLIMTGVTGKQIVDDEAALLFGLASVGAPLIIQPIVERLLHNR
ncbi:hypothetical protein GCM10009735_59130 [Actinomadura chokoriensis]